jgi:hypothetical protein
MNLKSAFAARALRRFVYAVSLVGIASTSAVLGAPPSSDAESVAQEAWRDSIANTEAPSEGCFMAEYPSLSWMPVGCVKAPARPFIPRSGKGGTDIVGDGTDYAASVSGLLSKTIGSFPAVKGVKTEVGAGGPNDYSLQLNSNFMTTAACKGKSGCQSWQQFIYASGEQLVFMQYWLIKYGTTCPTGWTSFETDCYTNSRAVTAPVEAITSLQTLKVSGTAKLHGFDSVVFTAGTMAYSTTGKDSMVDLATAWQQSEFNIIGDGDGSAAVFNTGSTIRVKVAVTDGSTAAPTCAKNAGTTGETNNLNLRACTAAGGAHPYILFNEGN